jgi:hypothetical protein
MDEYVCAQIPAPCGQRSKQNPKDADHDHILPTLIRVNQTKHQPLSHHGNRNASGKRMKLPLYIASKCQFLANASSDRSSNPNKDFKKALWQQAVDGFRATRPQQRVNAIGRALPQHPERQSYSHVHRNAFP